MKAPFPEGQELGTLTVALEGEILAELPLVAAEGVEQAGLFARLWDMIKLFVLGLFS